MRISDWSSDVCSSDLGTRPARHTVCADNNASRLGTAALVSTAAISRCAPGRSTGLRWRSPSPAAPRSARSRDCVARSEEHTSELQSLMRISYAVFCLKKKTQQTKHSIDRLTSYKTYH